MFNPEAKRSELRKEARYIADNFLKEDAIHITAYGGSIGDTYGFVHPKSDIDLCAFTSDFDKWNNNNIKPTVEWGEDYKWKRKTVLGSKERPDIIIDVIKNKETGQYASIAFYPIEPLDRVQAADYLDYFEKTAENNEGVLDRNINRFVETDVIRDYGSFYKSVKGRMEKVFGKKRKKNTDNILNGGRIKFLLMKLSDEKSVSETGSIDAVTYNMRAKEVIDYVTAAECYIKNIPRSLEGIQTKRNINLWKKLGLNAETMNKTQIRNASDIYESLQTLEAVVSKAKEDAETEFGMWFKE